MTPDNLEQIIAQGECLTVEFKLAREKLPDNLFETVCAFLNRQGGHIVLGVADDGSLTGVNPASVDSLKQNFASLSNNQTKLNPPFLLELAEVELQGYLLLYVFVPQSSQVHKCGNTIFDRSHEGDFRVTDSEAIGRMYTRKSAFYSETKIYPFIGISEFNQATLNRARQLIRSRAPAHPWLGLSDEEMIRSAGLYRKDYQTGEQGYTLAAVLLFGRDDVIQDVLPHYRTDALVRRENVDRYDDRADIRTNLIDAYDLLMQFVAKHLPDRFFLQGDQRVSLRDTIFREITANLIVHREYTNATPARLIIWDLYT